MQSIIDFLLHCEKKGLIVFTASIEQIKHEVLTEWIGVPTSAYKPSAPHFDKETTSLAGADSKNRVGDLFIPQCSKQLGPQLADLAVRVEQCSHARDVEPPSQAGATKKHVTVSRDARNAMSLDGRDRACAPPHTASSASQAPNTPDEPSTVTSEGSERGDFKRVVNLSTTPETDANRDHELPSHSPLEHSGHTPRKETNTPEPTVSDAYADLGLGTHTAPLLSLAPTPNGNTGTSVLGWSHTVAKLKFSPDSGTYPLATKLLGNGPSSPPTYRTALWRGDRQSVSTAYGSEEEESSDDGDFEHIVHLSTPEAIDQEAIDQEAIDQPSLSSPAVTLCGNGGYALPAVATTQVSTSSVACITAVGERNWKAGSTKAFLDFSPDFCKGISAFAPHQPSNELNAPDPVLKSNDHDWPNDGLIITAFISRNDGMQDCLNSTADKENILKQDSAIFRPHPPKPPLQMVSKSNLRETDHSAASRGGGSVAMGGESSDDDEMDKKLDDLLSDLRIRSTKKNSGIMRTVSRKSLEAFIVSDSDVGEDDDNIDAPPPTTPSIEHTPSNVPSSRAFVRRPFAERPQLSTPVDNTAQKPSHARCLSALTPSAHKSFARNKDQMARELYQLFNQTVFNNQLPENMEIRWNRKMRTTAGFCYNSGLDSNKSSRIELSLKVCNSYDRIRDTLIHELCHAATWLINGIKKGGHGNEWQAWATAANKVYPSIQRIERCHNYNIEYKYMYKCTRCDFRHGRHSKSVDLEHKRCPRCLSVLQLEPKLNVDGTPASTRKLTRYAQFIQDNYSGTKKALPQLCHKEIMEVLREKYHTQRAEAGQEL